MILSLLVSLCLQAEPEPVFSGPQATEGTPGFTVLDLLGPEQGQRIDYVERFGNDPSLYIFLHEVTRPAGRLVKLLDGYAAERAPRLKALLVALNDDTLTGELTIPRTLQSLQFQSRCGVSVDGKEGPGAWGLNKDMAMTVVLAREGKVVANWALQSPNETDFEKIRDVIEAELVPRLETLEDLRAELLRQQAEIQALKREVAELRARGAAAGGSQKAGAKKGAGMDGMDGAMGSGRADRLGKASKKADKAAGRGAGQRPSKGDGKSDKAGKDNDELMQLLRPLANPSATREEIDAAIATLDAYVADDPQRQERLARAVRQLDDRGRGNEAARTARAKYLDQDDR